MLLHGDVSPVRESKHLGSSSKPNPLRLGVPMAAVMDAGGMVGRRFAGN